MLSDNITSQFFSYRSVIHAHQLLQTATPGFIYQFVNCMLQQFWVACVSVGVRNIFILFETIISGTNELIISFLFFMLLSSTRAVVWRQKFLPYQNTAERRRLPLLNNHVECLMQSSSLLLQTMGYFFVWFFSFKVSHLHNRWYMKTHTTNRTHKVITYSEKVPSNADQYYSGLHFQAFFYSNPEFE